MICFVKIATSNYIKYVWKLKVLGAYVNIIIYNLIILYNNIIREYNNIIINFNGWFVGWFATIVWKFVRIFSWVQCFVIFCFV